ncbi:hypothetical protein OG244_15060 [Streptomyces brevispora]|uniref:hypothetical protein n=1 Tax=Streptomyces brevispora TaxID=887462 RepID=UPI002E34484E|nr:hypothetical protein [Streptomyces brevispora]
MTGVGYAAEITVTNGQRAVSLGEVVVGNRRLALRWLRRQALRLAEGLGFPSGSACSGGMDVRSAVLQSSGVLNGLRAWAEDQEQQDEAMARLEAGYPDAFTVVDPVAGLLVTLAGRRVRSNRAAGDLTPTVQHGGDGRPRRQAEPEVVFSRAALQRKRTGVGRVHRAGASMRSPVRQVASGFRMWLALQFGPWDEPYRNSSPAAPHRLLRGAAE